MEICFVKGSAPCIETCFLMFFSMLGYLTRNILYSLNI